MAYKLAPIKQTNKCAWFLHSIGVNFPAFLEAELLVFLEAGSVILTIHLKHHQHHSFSNSYDIEWMLNVHYWIMRFFSHISWYWQPYCGAKCTFMIWLHDLCIKFILLSERAVRAFETCDKSSPAPSKASLNSRLLKWPRLSLSLSLSLLSSSLKMSWSLINKWILQQITCILPVPSNASLNSMLLKWPLLSLSNFLKISWSFINVWILHLKGFNLICLKKFHKGMY